MIVDIEDRLTAALDRLASAYVPDEATDPVGRPVRTRRVVAVAAALVAVVGVGGLAVIGGDRSAEPVTTTPPTVDSTLTVTSPPTTGVTDVRRRLATLPEEIGGAGEMTSPAQSWLYESASPLFAHAVRRSSDGAVDNVVSWSLLFSSEWDKSFWDQPDVTLPSGAVAKRLVASATAVVVYALRLDDGRVVTARTASQHEDEMAAWFDAVVRPSDPAALGTLPPPDGYEPVASPEQPSTVTYPPIEVSVITVRFPSGAAWDVATWAATDPTVADVTPVDGHDAVAAVPVDGLQPSVFVRLDDSTGVRLIGPGADELIGLIDDLTVRDVGPGDIPEAAGPMDVPATATDVSMVLGEVSLGRVAIIEYTDGARQCLHVDTNFAGASGDCTTSGKLERTVRWCHATAGLVPDSGEWEHVAVIVVQRGNSGSVGISINGQEQPVTIERINSPNGDSGLDLVWATAPSDAEAADVVYLADGRPLPPTLGCG